MQSKGTESPERLEQRMVNGQLFLILLGLYGVGIAQPFFALIGQNPTFFVAHRSGRSDILLLTAVIFLAPTIFTWLVAAGTERLAPAAARFLLPAGLAVLGAISLAGYLWRSVDMQIEVALPLVLLLTGLLVVAFRRDSIRMLMRNLGWISPVFPAMFIFLSPVWGLLSDGQELAVGTGTLADATTETSVALIVFDELPLSSMLDGDGQIDNARLPNFARLAEMSTWYPNTTTVSTQTLVAVPTILSGLLNEDAPIPTAQTYPSNLFTELATTHRVEAWESVTRLCPTTVCVFPDLGWGLLLDDSLIIIQNQILPPGVAKRWVPEINNQWTRFRQPKVTVPRELTAEDDWAFPWEDWEQDLPSQFRSLTSKIGKSDNPTFYYEHVLLPHSPWVFRPDGTPTGIAWTPLEDDAVWPTGADHRRGVLMYAMQLEMVDMLVGEFLDSAEATGRLDEMLLVVVADHGMGLQAGLPSREITPQTMAELHRVPLFVKYPGQEDGEIDERPAEILDLFPTVAGVVGLEERSDDGRSGARLDLPPVEGRMQTVPVDPEEFQAAVDRFHEFVPPGASSEPIFDEFERSIGE